MNHLESPLWARSSPLPFLTRGRESSDCNKYTKTQLNTWFLLSKWRCDHRSCIRLSNCELSPENYFRALTGLTPMAAALVLQCSTNWAVKTHTLGAGQFVEYSMFLVEYCSANAEAMDSNPVENSKLHIVHIVLFRFVSLPAVHIIFILILTLFPDAHPWSCFNTVNDFTQSITGRFI